MNHMIPPKRIICLFLIYLALVSVFTVIYWCIYGVNKNSFVIQSDDFERELLITDSLLKIQREALLIEEEGRITDNIKRNKSFQKLYNDFLKDSSMLVKKHGNAIPQTIRFSNYNAISSRINPYIDWISSDGNQEYVFFPEYEGPEFKYRFLITDYELNEDKRIIVQRINVNLIITDKNNSNSIKRDGFVYQVKDQQMHLDEFHNEIVKSRISDIFKMLKSEEKKLGSVKYKLNELRKDKKLSMELTLMDFFYFSTNIQTTGDLIDILPNSTSVRTVISIQRIFNLFLLTLVFTYYLQTKDKNEKP